MSHERGSPGPKGASVPRPSTTGSGIVARVKRHLRTWPERYVEMRTQAVDERGTGIGGGDD